MTLPISGLVDKNFDLFKNTHKIHIDINNHDFFKIKNNIVDFDIIKALEFSSDIINQIYRIKIDFNLVLVPNEYVSSMFFKYLTIFSSDDPKLFTDSTLHLARSLSLSLSVVCFEYVFKALKQSLCIKYDKLTHQKKFEELSPDTQIKLYHLNKQKLSLLFLGLCLRINWSKLPQDLLKNPENKFFLEMETLLKQIFDTNLSDLTYFNFSHKPLNIIECPVCLEQQVCLRLDLCCHSICEDCKNKCDKCPLCRVAITLKATLHSVETSFFMVDVDTQTKFLFYK